jgi:hypothetical protein
MSADSPTHTPVPTDAAKPVFDSLEAERAYYTLRAEQFKNQLNQQVYDLQADTAATAKKGLFWGGAYLLAFGVARTLFGTHKHVVDTPEGPKRVAEKESLVASALKGAALLGAGVLATNVARRVVEQRQNTRYEQDPSLEPDTTEL